jgi:hypothetical protein
MRASNAETPTTFVVVTHNPVVGVPGMSAYVPPDPQFIRPDPASGSPAQARSIPMTITELPDDVRALLDGPNYAHLVTVLPNGAPHSVPVWVGLEGDHIAFLTSPGSRKARNLDRDRSQGRPIRAPRTRAPPAGTRAR